MLLQCHDDSIVKLTPYDSNSVSAGAPVSSDSPRPDGSKPLHPLELRILIAVSQRPSHGYRIVKRVEAAEGDRFRLYPANLYRRIRDLLSRGLLSESEAPKDDEDPDPRRTYFGLTPLGREVVRLEVARLEELLNDARSAVEPA